MGIGRARERDQWEPAGGGALPFKESLGAGSREPALRDRHRPGLAAMSLQVSWVCARCCGRGGAYVPEKSARVGRGAGVTPRRGCGASLTRHFGPLLPVLFVPGSCPRGPPRHAHPIASAPLLRVIRTGAFC